MKITTRILIRGAKRRRSQRANHDLHISNKTLKTFSCTYSEVFWSRQDAALEEANPRILFVVIFFTKKRFQKKKHQKMKITTRILIRGPKRRRSRRANHEWYIDFSGRPTSDSAHSHLRRFPTPYPSPEGLSGVRRP